MFQHTGRHIKHRPMCRPDLEGVTPLPNIVD
ncbi:exodeoxyribonuclease VII [Neisseria gonorrhoeae]|nr:exodeoxyribonuclease VII [Neisseria gonorrhoeae]KDN00356.1 exodeoxyribonuclease VII [Neisseria gonorrhoeae]KDN02399.1 exodeoxyribonuclease VII [Neisseria gonorrhoeae]